VGGICLLPLLGVGPDGTLEPVGVVAVAVVVGVAIADFEEEVVGVAASAVVAVAVDSQEELSN